MLHSYDASKMAISKGQNNLLYYNCPKTFYLYDRLSFP